MPDYEIFPFPSDREVVIDAGYLGARRHIIYSFFEFDVTLARRLIEESSARAGGKISFTAFIVASLAKATQDNT